MTARRIFGLLEGRKARKSSFSVEKEAKRLLSV
jgi:hypothetical protein